MTTLTAPPFNDQENPERKKRKEGKKAPENVPLRTEKERNRDHAKARQKISKPVTVHKIFQDGFFLIARWVRSRARSTLTSIGFVT